MTDRREVLQTLAARIARTPAHDVVRVAIDGVDGAGKTHLADELAPLLAAHGRATIRASVDGFHNPRAVRYRQGRDSPEGFFHDSYDYAQLKAVLLDPLSPGGSGRYRVAAFDHRSDQPVHPPEQVASPGAILLFDGIFLHRPELRAYWDYSIFLQVGFHVSIPRGAQRGEGSPDPTAPANRRYVRGQQLYLGTCDPTSWATVVIDNDDLASPCFVERSSRRPLLADAAVLFPYVYRTPVVETLQWDGPESRASFQREWERIVDRARGGQNHFFVILDPESSEPIGACDVRPDGYGTGDLGLWIGEPHQGRGRGTRAIADLVRYSRETLGLRRLEASIFVDNWPSRRAFEKNGFVLEGVLRDATIKRGTPRDEWRMVRER